MRTTPRQLPVVLLTLVEHTSRQTGRPFMRGSFGSLPVVAYLGEPDQWGNRTWNVWVRPAPRRARAAGPRTPPPHEPARDPEG